MGAGVEIRPFCCLNNASYLGGRLDLEKKTHDNAKLDTLEGIGVEGSSLAVFSIDKNN